MTTIRLREVRLIELPKVHGWNEAHYFAAGYFPTEKRGDHHLWLEGMLVHILRTGRLKDEPGARMISVPLTQCRVIVPVPEDVPEPKFIAEIKAAGKRAADARHAKKEEEQTT